jgi:hypothetical protein
MRLGVRLLLISLLGCAALFGTVKLLYAPEEPFPRGVLTPTAAQGIGVEAKLSDAPRGFVIDATIINRRDRPLSLEPDACGQAGTALLRRADDQGRGRTWPSRSIQTVKASVLEQQTTEDREPEPIPPTGRCERATAPIALEPGEQVRRRWKVERSMLLDAVGAQNASVEIDVREAGRRIASGSTRGLLAPTVDWPVRRSQTTKAEHFDRLLSDPRLSQLIDAEPSDSWIGAAIFLKGDQVMLQAFSSRYRQPFVATAHVGSGPVDIRVPTRRVRPPSGGDQLS